MKTNLLFWIIIVATYFQPSISFGQNWIDPTSKDLGQVGQNEYFYYVEHFTQGVIGERTYSVSVFYSSFGGSNWIHIDPSSFTLYEYGAEKDITFSGYIPTAPIGHPEDFSIEYIQTDNPDNDIYETTTYTTSSIGVEDWLSITDFNSSFSVGDPVQCTAQFNLYNDYDNMVFGNLNMQI
jgi:hypothetical protein